MSTSIKNQSMCSLDTSAKIEEKQLKSWYTNSVSQFLLNSIKKIYIYILFFFLFLYNWKKFFVPIFVLRLLNKHNLQRLGAKNQNELLVKFKDKLYLEKYHVHNKS